MHVLHLQLCVLSCRSVLCSDVMLKTIYRAPNVSPKCIIQRIRSTKCTELRNGHWFLSPNQP